MLSIAASANPTPSPAAKAAQGEPKRTISAATSPFKPRRAPESTVNGAEGAAATAAIAARPPTSPKVSATSVSTGSPTKRAASGSDAIACSARPWRVRSRAQAASAASPAARPITKNDRICTLAPAIVTIPFRPRPSKWNGSGKT